MPSSTDAYLNCDLLENIPVLNKDNWLFELDFLRRTIKENSSVLQIGSMDGARIINILKARPDLKLTGLEIEKKFVDIAKEKLLTSGLTANFIHADITNPPVLPLFDYCVCLNNTLGYISNDIKAIEEMKKLARTVILSVYGEKFGDNLAHLYFESIGLEIENIINDKIFVKDFGIVKRYTKNIVEGLGNNIVESPVGYIVTIQH